MNNTKEIGTPEEFHSKKCYDLYLYAVSLAKQVNEYLDKGFIIFNGEDVFSDKFIFYHDKMPVVGYKSGRCFMGWLGQSWDKNGKVWIQGEDTKTSIKKMFSKFRFVRPENIEKLKF